MTDLCDNIQAYHFTDTALRDGSPLPAIGEWLEHTGPLILCESGLHASERVLDALHYAPGLTLHRVTVSGALRSDDKLVAKRRRIESSREVPFRTVVRLAIEAACLAAWCARLYLPDLLVALEACDREDWGAATRSTDAAFAAASAAARTAGAAEAAGAADAAYAAASAAASAARATRSADAAARAAAGVTWKTRNDAGAAGFEAAKTALESRAHELVTSH